jgi:hypothetical protein
MSAGRDTMRKASRKAPKGKKTTKVNDLTVKNAKAVKGGKGDGRLDSGVQIKYDLKTI